MSENQTLPKPPMSRWTCGNLLIHAGPRGPDTPPPAECPQGAKRPPTLLLDIPFQLRKTC